MCNPCNQLILHSILPNTRNTTRSDFKFYADRLIRLVIEESLNQLPYSVCKVQTPTGAIYGIFRNEFWFKKKNFVQWSWWLDGLKYRSGNCGVSIVRSGEAMEQGLRDCCRSIRIGKILVESDAETHVAKVVYARFPDDIARRQVLLMYPIMSTGNTVVQVGFYQWKAIKQIIDTILTFRRSMYSKSMEFQKIALFCPICFVLPWQRKR